MTTVRFALLTYVALGVVLWPLPLLNILHVESSAVVAFVAFFVAGRAALNQFEEEQSSVWWVVVQQEGTLLVVLAMLTVSLAWAPNCDYLRGLLFFVLFPGVTVFFAVMLAYALTGTSWRSPMLILSAIGFSVALGGVVYDLGFHPQFYTYNHVFGGVLGPIYDERLALRPGLFAFRGLTLLWALAAYGVGLRLRGRFPSAARIGLGVLILLIGSAYLFSARLGFNTPAWHLQAQLGSRYSTEHFDIYYDSTAIEPDEIVHRARDHEYRYAWLADKMEASGPDRVVSYLYPDPETKARLTGARQTSIAPVWLATPQVHLLQDNYSHSFGHELVHVFTRPFGLPVVNASWSVGMVEGIAVALEPPDGRPTPREQVAVAALSDSVLTGSSRLAEDLAARFSPLGFWTGRGAVSYTTMGSFVQFLLERYGPAELKQVYAWTDFEAVYGQPVDALAEEWQRWVGRLSVVDRSTQGLVTRRFTRPSLFERRCPHYVPPYQRALEAGREALTAGDTTQAEIHVRTAVRSQPRSEAAQVAWARLQLACGETETVAQRLDTLALEPPSASLMVIRGDAAALLNRPEEARQYYQQTLDRLPIYAHESQAQVMMRRAVATRPTVLRVLVSADSAHVQARRLARLPDRGAVVQSWQALRHMQAREYKAAFELWNQIPPSIDSTGATYVRDHLRRQYYGWNAHCALWLERWAVAERHARTAAEAFRRVGALNLADQFGDLARKARWMNLKVAANPLNPRD